MKNIFQDTGETRKSTQAEKSDRMRKEILLAAISCLHEFGYHRASIKKITEKTRFSQGALQHHFPTKEDLMVFVLERLLAKSVRLTLEWLNEIGEDKSRISELTIKWWTNQANSPEYLTMMEILVAARTEDTLRRRIKPTFDNFAKVTDDRILAIFESDQISQATARTLITASRQMMTGLITSDGLFMREEDKQAYIEHWAMFLQQLFEQRVQEAL
ncbi:transcriptional regulator, TetR family [Pseudovibrio denitrificans]|uniref:Transcriptional regulator, TetR family n=1 Tax=Pseudovibrio denitrificans TaxID=258256 RepID=A0A1I7CJA4_9HYPH|nr:MULTISPECIES: TetR/AcrR family transcriptional regulator [Pseudovibrio]EEA92072.1 putative transcriptional regulator [Pseudovibrio sp. JE062]SFT99521.1 transcriptional regulator, TetR family [Pseudovibrio denitrificans]